MSNDKKAKYVSKGERNSGGRIKRQHPAIMPHATHIQSAMAVAFTSACIKGILEVYAEKRVPSNMVKANLVKTVNSMLSRKDSMKPVGRGWTANLSPATVKKLVKEGVFA